MDRDKLRNAAWDHHRSGRLKEAEAQYRELIENARYGIKLEVSDAINLGGLLRQQGRLKEAINHYKEMLEKCPRENQLRANAINCYIEAKRLDEALQIGLTGLSNKEERDHGKLLEAYGRVLLARRDYKKAKLIYKEIIQKDKNSLDGLLGLGQTYDGLSCHKKALNIFQRIMDIYPDDPRGVTNTILTLKQLGEYEHARDIFNKLTPKEKNIAMIKSAMATLTMDTQDHEAAALQFKDLCILEPGNSANWLNYAATMKALKHNNECHRSLKNGLLWSPLNIDLKQAIAQSYAEMGKHKSAVMCLNEVSCSMKTYSSSFISTYQFIGASYNIISSEKRKKLTVCWEKQLKKEGIGALWGDRMEDGLTQRKLKVGYLSADFTSHPVGRFIKPILKEHNHKEIEVYGINCGPHEDNNTTEIRKLCKHWIDIRHLTDIEAARLISDQRLDVLVELGGYTAHNRMAVLVHKPAKIQLSYLGYCAPTYLDCIDGWIGDETLFSTLNKVDKMSHKLLKVKNGYMTFKPDSWPQLRHTKHNGIVRFGSFNHGRKLTKEKIVLFSKVIEKVENSELVLKSISFIEEEERKRIKDMFIKQGMPEKKIKILPWVKGWENHMMQYNQVDVALDPIPYGGATTTCEALVMGVPIITLSGEGMVGQLSASILNSAGLNEWITHSKDEYINKAKIIANSMIDDRLTQKELLRAKMKKSALSDAKRVSRNLEKLYYNATR